MKERWFNYRPICLTAAFLLLGSVFAFYFNQKMLLTIIVSVICATSLFVIANIRKKFRYFIVPLTAFVIGVFAFNIAVYSFDKSIQVAPNYIEARISGINSEEDGSIRVSADSVKFDDKKARTNLTIIIYDSTGLFENIEIGRVIKFSPNKLFKSDLNYYSTPNAKMFQKNLKYTTTVKYDDIEFKEINRSLADKVKDTVKQNLDLGLTNENKEIAFSSLFGDKSELGEANQNAFRSSGIAHLLAVSGLHVGIIVMALSFILKKLHIRKWWKFGVISIFLLFYIYICDFSVSIIRASIMTCILLISKILKEEYDIYNSISIAAIVIFIINPLCIFDISFLMSFSCVLGIAMLYKPIKTTLSKLKANEKIIDSLSLSLSATLSLVVISTFYFQNINAISIVANIILIPIFTIAFIPMFIVSMLSVVLSIFPFIPEFLGYALYPLNYIFSFITLFATWLGNLSFSSFNTIEIHYTAIIVYFTLLLFIGRLCSAKSEYKLIISLPTLALLVWCLL